MMPNDKLRNGESLVGTMIRFSRNPLVAHFAKNAGFDYILMDMEHGAYSFDNLSDIFMMCRGLELGAYVRVPELNKGFISRVLDLGANGVLVPMVETKEQAEEVAYWAKYPPVGNRGLTGVGGHTDYKGTSNVPEMFKQVNNDVITIVQIETVKGVQNAEKIAAVEGIDVLLIGPNDLSVSYGFPGDVNNPIELEGIEKVLKACNKHGKVFGIHGAMPIMEKFVPMGTKFVMNYTDMEVLRDGFKEVNDRLRKLIP